MKKKRIEVKKPNIIDRIIFALSLPDIPSKDDGERPFKILKTKEYNLMKNMIDGIPGYTTQIRKQNEDLKNLQKELDLKSAELTQKEDKRRKLVAKLGGLQTSLNNCKRINNELIKKLEDIEVQIDLKDKEIEMLRNKGKRKKDIESYKNYFEARRELEKREKSD